MPTRQKAQLNAKVATNLVHDCGVHLRSAPRPSAARTANIKRAAQQRVGLATQRGQEERLVLRPVRGASPAKQRRRQGRHVGVMRPTRNLPPALGPEPPAGPAGTVPVIPEVNENAFGLGWAGPFVYRPPVMRAAKRVRPDQKIGQAGDVATSDTQALGGSTSAPRSSRSQHAGQAPTWR